jgi:hypothetical protein
LRSAQTLVQRAVQRNDAAERTSVGLEGLVLQAVSATPQAGVLDDDTGRTIPEQIAFPRSVGVGDVVIGTALALQLFWR